MGYYLDETTFVDELIAFLGSCKSSSIRKRILWERVSKRRKISQKVYNQTLYRLKKGGYINTINDRYFLSEKGKICCNNPYKRIKEKFKGNKKIIIIFDIPENHKKAREWIRQQIKYWDFKMIQKSVWMGFGPLPKEFDKRLKILKVDKGVKIMKVQTTII